MSCDLHFLQAVFPPLLKGALMHAAFLTDAPYVSVDLKAGDIAGLFGRLSIGPWRAGRGVGVT